MIENMNSILTRFLILDRKGVERREALKWSLVLSFGATTPEMTAIDFLVVNEIAKRKAPEAPSPAVPSHATAAMAVGSPPSP